MHSFFTVPAPDKHNEGSKRRSSAAASLTVFLMVFCFIFSTLAQPVQAAVTVTASDSEPEENNRTTMYVSSALTGRSGLCVLLDNVDASVFDGIDYAMSGGELLELIERIDNFGVGGIFFRIGGQNGFAQVRHPDMVKTQHSCGGE